MKAGKTCSTNMILYCTVVSAASVATMLQLWNISASRTWDMKCVLRMMVTDRRPLGSRASVVIRAVLARYYESLAAGSDQQMVLVGFALEYYRRCHGDDGRAI